MIQKLSDRRTKLIRRLSDGKMRRKTGEYLVEGFSLVEEAIKRPRSIDLIVLTKSAVPNANIILDIAEDKAIPVFSTSDKDFKELATTNSPQGVIAVVKRDIEMARKLFTQALDKDPSLIFYLDGIQDPGNLGAIIRSAEAVGASAVIAGENTVEITNPKVIRGSMGAFFNIPVLDLEEANMGINGMKRRGFTVAATLLSPEAISIWDYEPPTKLLVVFGNEARGISFDVIEKSDVYITIPIDGSSESFGVTASAAIISAILRNKQKKVVK